MPCPFLIFSQSDYLIHIVDINSHTQWQTVQIQISWLLQKPTDLALHCLQRQDISGTSRTRVKFCFISMRGCFCKMCMHLENIGFSSSYMGFLVGLYITIYPHFFFFFIIIIQSHTFAEENCALSNIVK